MDVTAFSISSFAYLNKICSPKSRIRATILLTDSFHHKSLKEILEALPSRVEEVTFKVLHDSHGYNQSLDAWVQKHSLSKKERENLKKEVESYQENISIFYDSDCMEAENRYMVFREDGNLYKDYESREKV